jgi:hypothetical protein
MCNLPLLHDLRRGMLGMSASSGSGGPPGKPPAPGKLGAPGNGKQRQPRTELQDAMTKAMGLLKAATGKITESQGIKAALLRASVRLGCIC